MITRKIIEHIEGEATLHFELKEQKVSFATVSFPHFRAMESMLEGKHALDALVITPRVCGICGHAHLMASVLAIEDAYKNSKNPLKLSTKAKNIRELTLVLEMIQNHLKWIYMVVLPSLEKLTKIKVTQTPLKGAYGASLATKVLAIFAGQWPHSSYMIPGGITSDVTFVELTKAKSYLSKLINYFEEEILGTTLQRFLAFESCKDFKELKSDVHMIETMLIEAQMHTKGFAHDQFLVLGKHDFSNVSKVKSTTLQGVESKYVGVEAAYSPNEKSYAKNALYKNCFYETGPLSRSMAKGFKLIKNMHRRFKDSAYTRVMARIYETGYLMQHAQTLLDDIDVSQDSCSETKNIKGISAEGEGVVEAPRGPLLHRVSIVNGIIQKYTIITPTQFNISSGTKQKLSPAQKAMQGNSEAEAEFIFRTFDVCSVCTTH
ncbi:nickel-dependent hydrogenase large subunit [Sulfurimonas sp.]